MTLQCTPTDRVWPGQRCVRCVRYNYACSQNFTAKASSQHTTNTSQQGHPIWHKRNVTNHKDLLTPNGGRDGLLPKDFDGSSKADNAKGNSSYSTNPSKDEHSNAHSTPRCAKLFTNLTDTWNYPKEPSTNKKSWVTILDELRRDCSISSLMVNGIQRMRSVDLYQLQQIEVEKKVACGMPQGKAVKLVTTNLFTKFQEIGFDYQETISVTDFVKHISSSLQAGKRWQELIDDCGCREILLIDEVIGYDDVKASDDQDQDDKQHNKVNSEVDSTDDSEVESENQAKALLMDEDDIMQHGTNTEFRNLKRILLTPELCLKATCQHLDGVLAMMERLGFGDRSFLRLCGDAKIDNGDEHPLSNDLTEFLASETERRIEKVFGKPKPIRPWPLESPEYQDNNGEGDQSLAAKINVGETTAGETRNSGAEALSESNTFSGKGNSAWNHACKAIITSGDNTAPSPKGVSNMSKDILANKCAASKQDASPKRAMFPTENTKSNPNTSNNDNTTGAVSNIGFELAAAVAAEKTSHSNPTFGEFSTSFNSDFWSNVEVDFDFKSLQI